ncbi:MAG: DUF2971 domain-containing protein [Pseudomonadota bacterium]
MPNATQLVYKYRDFRDRTLEIFENNEIYFSSPEDLNDPLDCQPPLTATLKHLIENEPQKKIKEILDSPDLIFFAKNMENAIRQQAIFSLSEKGNEPLLWSHYADKHKGLAIGFDTNYLRDLIAPLKEYAIHGLFKMNYEKTPPFRKGFKDAAYKVNKLNIFKCNEYEFRRRFKVLEEKIMKDFIQYGIHTKSKDWSYEREVRLVKEGKGKVKFHPEAIQEIVFGLNMDEPSKQVIRKILSGPEWNHVQYKKVEPASGTFSFKVVPCD